MTKRKMALYPIARRDDGSWARDVDGCVKLCVESGSDMNDLGRLVSFLRLSGANIEIEEQKGEYSLTIRGKFS